MVAPRDLTVLMAAHVSDRPDWLAQALDSVLDQTVPAAECVLVVDGPLAPEHEAVIARFAPRLKLLRLPQCGGLAAALNAGLPLCSGSWIARMDSDDLSLPHRFERQLQALGTGPECDIMAAWSAEFEGEPSQITAIKTTPVGHKAIAAMLKWRCCLTHPSIVVRKAMLEKVGGYRGCFGDLADYDLYVRVLLAGGRIEAVPEPLVLFRVSHEQRLRRGGWAYAARELAFRRFCLRAGFLSLPVFLATATLMVAFRLSLPGLKKSLYPLVREKPTAVPLRFPLKERG